MHKCLPVYHPIKDSLGAKRCSLKKPPVISKADRTFQNRLEKSKDYTATEDGLEKELIGVKIYSMEYNEGFNY